MKPLRAAAAKALAVKLLSEGRFRFTRHIEKELASDELSTVDAENVIRGGVVDEPEYENGEWRYKARTQRITVVFAFDDADILILVTAWRIKR